MKTFSVISKKLFGVSLVALMGLPLSACVAGEDAFEDEEVGVEVVEAEQNLYGASTKIWSNHKISVCWESSASAYPTERGWVEQAAKASWDAESDVEFVGFGTCTAGQAGIHIGVEDSATKNPHVKALGNGLNGMTNGMMLNFTYNNWGTTCKDTKEYCTKAIAVHEFGHALGFAHEQNRPDTPPSCTDAPQGSNGDRLLGAWDADSVMNYCNDDWNNDGVLSDGDISGVQEVYGAPLAPCPSNAVSYRGLLASDFVCTCDGTESGAVWGTGTYTDDSRICRAALHAGAITSSGGRVRVKIAAGQSSYVGSTNNGITTSGYSGWYGSFTVEGVSDVPACPNNMVGYRGKNDSFLLCKCASTPSGTVWGTEVYTDDSPICRAAAHAGVSYPNENVLVLVQPGQSSYTGSTANGITTVSYGSWSGSYRFLPYAGAPVF